MNKKNAASEKLLWREALSKLLNEKLSQEPTKKKLQVSTRWRLEVKVITAELFTRMTQMDCRGRKLGKEEEQEENWEARRGGQLNLMAGRTPSD